MTEDPRIDRLRRLLKEKRAERPRSVPEPVPSLPETLESPDPDERPTSLQGLTFREIQLLQLDLGLTPEQEEWLATKNIPSSDGLRMPNLKFVSQRGKKQVTHE